ncbi:MAG: hypothetical protein ACRERU_21315 [Methylococcales bacterium]
MNAQLKKFNDILFAASVRAGILNLQAMLLLSPCVTPPPYITLSEPKVYSDDQVIAALNDQYRKLQETTKYLTAEDLQKVIEIKQGIQQDANISAAPIGTAAVTAPRPISSDKLKVASLTMPSGEIGLSYSALLRKKWVIIGMF